MEPKGFHRKLTAILSADVAGYSRLMQDDEAATVNTLESYKQAFFDLIKQHRGRVVDSPGDNLLAEFASVVDAVQCAVAVQKEFHAHNAELPENRRMLFRIGVNLGDVIEEGERIYGDGVNIAARLESLADPGGICVSKTAFEQIETKLPFGYEYLGEQPVKNIAKPVGAYKLLMEPRVMVAGEPEKKPQVPVWRRKGLVACTLAGLIFIIGVAVWSFYFRLPPIEPASEKKMAFPLPDKPSIAVLPFVNLSENPKDEFIADGMSESIITALSKTPKMFVIARNSTFTYKGRAVNVQKVAEELGVQYVLEGSLQKNNDQLRIHAQLIDAIAGNHLWAEKYDRNIKDIFVLQDEITMKIITGLQVKLSQGEQASIIAKGTDNLEAYLKVTQGLQHMEFVNKEGDAIARKLAEEAILLDPNYPMAYLLLSRTQFREIMFGTTKSRELSLKMSMENVQKAISLDNSFAGAQAWMGWLYTILRQHDKGIDAAEKALALNPNSFSIYECLGLTLNYAGRHEEAIKIYQKAIRLSPIPSADTLMCLCVAFRDCGHYEEGISTAKRAVQLSPDNLFAHTCLASCYALLGREAEAKAESAEVLRIDPNFSLKHLEKAMPYKYGENTQAVIDSLRKAGLK